MFNTIKIVGVTLVLIAVSAPAHAKTRHFSNNGGSAGTRGLLDGAGAKSLSSAEIEARFRPFLEERVRERRGGGFGGAGGGGELSARPSQSDILALMKIWDDLGAEFRALYAEATAIPKNPDSLISPMGKFKIYYTKTGRDSVDVTDNIGYGAPGQPSEWRVRNPSPNGIPDYIDETAFALDSAWSMEIDRFKFPNPIAAAGREYYPVHINYMADYGITWPSVRIPGSSVGFFSHIEINGDWSDPDWGIYNQRPYDAVRVTCAHEFFHAVQYAMAWNTNTYIDDFPLGWLEGAAVLMEELAFPEVNDYLQYITDYFRYPARVSFLVDDNSHFEYLNSILFIYLYEKSAAGDNIGLVRKIHANKYAEKTLTFYENLERVSMDHEGKSWAELLNGFHTESYFTNRRARRPQAFTTDSELMRSWPVPAALSGAESKTVKPYSVEFFHYTPQLNHPDTLILNISGQPDQSAAGKTWGASVLVMENDDSVVIAPVSMDRNGGGRFELAGWKEKSGCLLVVTNASPNTARRITATPEGEGFVIPPDTTRNAGITVSHNIVKLRTMTEPIRVTGSNITEVKIYSTDGKLVFSGKRPINDTVEWTPSKRLAPGAYFMTATSSGYGKRKTRKQKIMILP